MKNHVWVIEMWDPYKKRWKPCEDYCRHTKRHAIVAIQWWKNPMIDDKYRVRKYEAV